MNSVLRVAAAAFLLVEDRLAELDALAADVDVAGPFDERADVAVALAAERAVGIAVAARTAGGSPSAAAFSFSGGHAVSCTPSNCMYEAGRSDANHELVPSVLRRRRRSRPGRFVGGGRGDAQLLFDSWG